MKTKGIRLILILLITLQLTGCWSSHEVNTIGLTVCIGIDKSDGGYRISEQVINPRAIASQRATNESPVTVFTAEGPDIQETITRLTTLTPRKIYSSHLRMVILSEEIAKEGIGDIIDYLLRYHEYRTDFYFAVAKGFTAEEILTVLTPTESIPGMEMYSKLKTSFEEWAPTKAIRIIELANNIMVDGINPVINAIEIVDDNEKTDSTDVLRKSGEYEKLRFTDMGAFSGDKLVGWLNEDESKGYSYIIGAVLRTSGSAVECGVELSAAVRIAQSRIIATVENSQPKIDVEVKVRQNIVGVKGELDVSKIENIETINKMGEDKIKHMCEMAVRKAQKELKTDIFGFGERVHAKDPAYWKTVKDNWNEVFAEMPVTIDVTVETVATGDLNKPLMKKD
jgi:spore germination protein KC